MKNLKEYKMFIDGWVESENKKHLALNPENNSLGQKFLASEKDVDKAVRLHKNEGKWSQYYQRKKNF